jgi:hypothetical protein
MVLKMIVEGRTMSYLVFCFCYREENFHNSHAQCIHKPVSIMTKLFLLRIIVYYSLYATYSVCFALYFTALKVHGVYLLSPSRSLRVASGGDSMLQVGRQNSRSRRRTGRLNLRSRFGRQQEHITCIR